MTVLDFRGLLKAQIFFHENPELKGMPTNIRKISDKVGISLFVSESLKPNELYYKITKDTSKLIYSAEEGHKVIKRFAVAYAVACKLSNKLIEGSFLSNELFSVHNKENDNFMLVSFAAGLLIAPEAIRALNRTDATPEEFARWLGVSPYALLSMIETNETLKSLRPRRRSQPIKKVEEQDNDWEWLESAAVGLISGAIGSLLF